MFWQLNMMLLQSKIMSIIPPHDIFTDIVQKGEAARCLL